MSNANLMYVVQYLAEGEIHTVISHIHICMKDREAPGTDLISTDLLKLSSEEWCWLNPGTKTR